MLGTRFSSGLLEQSHYPSAGVNPSGRFGLQQKLGLRQNNKELDFPFPHLNLSYHQMSVEDIPEFLRFLKEINGDLNKQAGEWSTFKRQQTLLNTVKRPNSYMTLLRDRRNKRIVGTVILAEWEEDPNIASLNYHHVIPPYNTDEVKSFLLHESLKKARQEHYESVHHIVPREAETRDPYYQKHGFEETRNGYTPSSPRLMHLKYPLH